MIDLRKITLALVEYFADAGDDRNTAVWDSLTEEEREAWALITRLNTHSAQQIHTLNRVSRSLIRTS